MPVLTLPGRSKSAIIVALMAISLSLFVLFSVFRPNALQIVSAILASAFLADALTAFAHFAFDYVFPYDFPVFGPISKEFNEHHEEPSLDPKDKVENLTKGAYASCVASLVSGTLVLFAPPTPVTAFALAVTTCLAIWGFFFHQMHSYAHMGSLLEPAAFSLEVNRIAQLPTSRERKAAFRAVFETVPIPSPIRWMQRLRLTLEPGRHNLHHLHFETDFSSVNGWSDPFLNPLLTPAARYFKSRRLKREAREAEV